MTNAGGDMTLSEAGVAATGKPPCLIVLGMAGSGKTTFVQQLTSWLQANHHKPYTINLDPAVHHVPYPINIDIRDTVKYKEVMKQYNLGPNGAIMTSLNLFATKFDQVINLLESKVASSKSATSTSAASHDDQPAECSGSSVSMDTSVSDSPASGISHVIIDTPGQIEVFTWSASGSIITESLAATFPVVIVYVMDTPRSHSPVTFMSNMLYACSILYKTKLPFVVVLNKADIIDPQFALEWMRDFEAFEEALSTSQKSYMTNLTRSMSLILDDFYNCLTAVGFSSVTGEGVPAFLEAVAKGVTEYETEYRPAMLRMRADVERRRKRRSEATASGGGDVATPSDVIRTEYGGDAMFLGNRDDDDTDSDSEGSSGSDVDDDEREREGGDGQETNSFGRFLAQRKQYTSAKQERGSCVDKKE